MSRIELRKGMPDVQLTRAVHLLFVMAENMGFGDRFIPRMIDVFQKINGLKK